MISDAYFENLALGLVELTEQVQLELLRRVKAIAERLIKDPEAAINLTREERRIIRLWQSFYAEATEWTDQNLPRAYIRGIEQANAGVSETAPLNRGAFRPNPLLGAAVPPAGISEAARRALSGFPDHLTMYGVFQQATYESFAATRLPVIRSAGDKIRNLVVAASDQAYRQADPLTRRELSQQIMRRLSDGGITGIRYSGGRTMALDSYAEMVARSQTGNASRQAHLNRLQEYGKDLVVISQHYPVSELCEPYQGKVFSLSGDSGNYPDLEEAISGGLYHSNCKHSQSGYTPGQPIPEAREAVDKAENERQYAAQKRQRYNERQIRAWKRREATALTEAEQAKAKAKISAWQGRQREHIEANSFLRRKYSREQI